MKHRVTGLFSPDREVDLKKVFAEKIPEVTLVSVDFKNSEVTFVYDADLLFNKPKPELLIERFDNLLRTHTLGTFGIRDLCKTPKDKLAFIEIDVVGLDCKGCCLGGPLVQISKDDKPRFEPGHRLHPCNISRAKRRNYRQPSAAHRSGQLRRKQ